MARWYLLLFFAAEVAAFVLVGQHIGFFWAALALIAVSAAGPFVVRRVGFRVVGRARERLAAGELPTAELLDGVVIVVGGLMISVPGFLSDVLGLLLMVPPVRHLVIRLAGARLARGVQGIRPGRWTVVDARSFPTGGPVADRDGDTRRSIGPGDGAGD